MATVEITRLRRPKRSHIKVWTQEHVCGHFFTAVLRRFTANLYVSRSYTRILTPISFILSTIETNLRLSHLFFHNV